MSNITNSSVRHKDNDTEMRDSVRKETDYAYGNSALGMMNNTSNHFYVAGRVNNSKFPRNCQSQNETLFSTARDQDNIRHKSNALAADRAGR